MKTNHGKGFADVLPGRGRSAVHDVITALRMHDGRLAAREQKVADYVKGNLDRISTMTIAELAGAAGVSSPTVIRFCRSLGCDGFREFKLRLAQNLAVSQQYLQVESGNDPARDSALNSVLASVHATANVVRQQIAQAQLDEVAGILQGARQLVIAGIGGGSSMIAEEAANRFFRLGIPAAAVSDSYLLQMRAATLVPGDVLLLFSTSGEADAVVAAARIAAGYGAQTVGITGSGSRLSDTVRVPVTVDLPEDPNIFKPTASRHAFLTILDALATTVAYARKDMTTENLRRIRASLTAYHGRTGPQPLGD
ncbi:MAG: MurR/RpiR family transcriptional regulator [Tropicimonas sp.]|uniref:MurR/RpiR family transcriptional regulator n=1 Tax=Tropicimonas sp. TaxID=2067044 RepID=UPI003A83EA42